MTRSPNGLARRVELVRVSDSVPSVEQALGDVLPRVSKSAGYDVRHWIRANAFFTACAVWLTASSGGSLRSSALMGSAAAGPS